MLYGVKSMFESRTVWAGLVSIIVVPALAWYGYSLDDATQRQVVDALLTLAGVGAGLGAIIGRIIATKTVTVSGELAPAQVGTMADANHVAKIEAEAVTNDIARQVGQGKHYEPEPGTPTYTAMLRKRAAEGLPLTDYEQRVLAAAPAGKGVRDAGIKALLALVAAGMLASCSVQSYREAQGDRLVEMTAVGLFNNATVARSASMTAPDGSGCTDSISGNNQVDQASLALLAGLAKELAGALAKGGVDAATGGAGGGDAPGGVAVAKATASCGPFYVPVALEARDLP